MCLFYDHKSFNDSLVNKMGSKTGKKLLWTIKEGNSKTLRSLFLSL